jgi:glycosyltransferase involved in cell wall biosynthesis
MGVETVPRLRKVCFFGGFTPGYPRSEVIRKGLLEHDVAVVDCHVSRKRRVPNRYIVLASRYMRLRRDFDIIFVPEFRHKDVPMAHFLGRMSGKPVVFDPLVSRYDTKILDRADANAGSFQAWHNRNLDRMSLTFSDLVFADTQAHLDYYVNELGASRDKLRVLPVGADEELFTNNGRTVDPHDDFIALFFGNYLPLHGVDVIVEAAAQLRDRADVRFVLVGGGQTFHRVKEIVDREALDNVELRERVPIEALSGLLASADVSLGIFGRTNKTKRVVANKVYQSMAAGKAVVTADSPAVREFFTDGEDISLVPPGDPTALAAKLEHLSKHPEIAGEIGRAGAERVRAQFSSGKIAARFISCCEELLDKV